MNQSVLILGGSSDIAVALAKIYIEKAYKVYLAGRKTDELKLIANDLQIRNGGKVEVVFFDAVDYSSHEKFVDAFDEVPAITIAVFGYLGDQKLAEKEWNECEKIIDTNYKGAVSILNRFANVYEKQGSGALVGISSVAGERGRQSNYYYGSAKAGFTAYLSGLRNRLYASSVHVMTVKPGFVETKMTEGMDLPGPITAKPDQVAKAIFKGLKRKKNTIYTLGIWRLIMYIIKTIPEFVFKRLKL